MGFKHDNYTVQEGSDVYVCVEVLSGYLETEIALLLNTESGTATGNIYLGRMVSFSAIVKHSVRCLLCVVHFVCNRHNV